MHDIGLSWQRRPWLFRIGRAVAIKYKLELKREGSTFSFCGARRSVLIADYLLNRIVTDLIISRPERLQKRYYEAASYEIEHRLLGDRGFRYGQVTGRSLDITYHGASISDPSWSSSHEHRSLSSRGQGFVDRTRALLQAAVISIVLWVGYPQEIQPQVGHQPA